MQVTTEPETVDARSLSQQKEVVHAEALVQQPCAAPDEKVSEAQTACGAGAEAHEQDAALQQVWTYECACIKLSWLGVCVEVMMCFS